jgi:hypothetical protein
LAAQSAILETGSEADLLLPCFVVSTARPMTTRDPTENIDPSLYPDRWIAVVRGRVVGVGLTRQQAQRAAKQTRPKDTPQLLFVHVDGKIEALGPKQEIELKLETNWLDSQPLLQTVIAILQARGIKAYLVGGAVRDLLLGKESVVDLDFAAPGDGFSNAREVAHYCLLSPGRNPRHRTSHLL